MTDYQYIKYVPLSPVSKHIRTLTLCAGGVRDTIKCTLRVVSLDDDPSYEALSYVWGDPTATAIIEVDGVRINVTSNLERALRHLREANNALTLWVDAVCINQDNMEEKSQQVALMGQIYRQCSQVRIWLGCNATKCELEAPLRRVDSMIYDLSKRQDPFELIRYLAGDRHIFEWPYFRGGDEEGELIFEENEKFRDAWAGFLKIAQSTWWSRMWTVQEVILPKAGILTYDIWSTPLENITKCGTNYYGHVWDCCQTATAKLPEATTTALDEFCTIFFTLNGDRNTLAEDEYFDIQEQHLSYGFRQCQNPRDMVYGLLAIIGNISDLDLWLTPDYSKSENEVFYDATCAMLYRDALSLRCLTGAEYGARASKWASWVRDFGAPLTQLDADVGSNWLMIYELFDASGGKRAEFEHYMSWPRLADEKAYEVGLRVKGKCVGRVSSVLSALDFGESKQKQRDKFREWVQASGLDFDDVQDNLQPPDAARKFWRTMLGGVASAANNTTEYSDWQRFKPETMSWLGPFLSWINTGEPELEIALGRTVLTATHGRCYFQTNSGQGLCYPTTAIGDEIWILNGSRVPFILRRINLPAKDCAELRPQKAYGILDDGDYGVREDYEPREELQGYYNMVGDCYLDGFMDGEAARNAELDEHFVVLV